MEFNFSEQEKEQLLKLARETIAAEANNQPLPDYHLGNEKLERPAGVFVTLHKQGMLRGCIGFVEAVKPLNESIQEMALSAAFGDPRFPAVKASEVPDLELEISVLSPMEKCPDVNQIEIGKHGLLIKNGFNSGLLLPQVAPEQGWNRQQFLEGVSQKGGLPKDAWQNSELFIFSAEIFHE